MSHRTNRIWWRLWLPAVLALSVFAVGTPQTGSTQATTREPAHIKSLLRSAIPGTRDLQLIIELTDPPVAQMLRSTAGSAAAAQAGMRQAGSQLALDSTQAVAYRAQLARTQAAMMQRLRALSGVQVQGSTDLVMNTIIARVPVEQYSAILKMPGVKKVYISRLRRKSLDASAVLLNAPALWALAGGRANAGQGVKIGMLDTGIDITNPMFADTATAVPSGFPKFDSSADAAFTNHKVIAARNYIGLLPNTQRVRTAVDEDGHGSFTAGCAAGKPVSAPLAQISGMAPGAFLGNYKIFGTPGINDFTTDAAVLAAINDAVSDGMDVLSLSFGGLDYIPPSEDPEVAAIHNAVAAGVVVVVAGGNDGPDTHTIGSPGTAPDAITVGAASNSRAFGSELHVTGPGAVPANLQNILYVNGSGPAISTAIPATPVTDVTSLDGTGLACSTLPAGSLSGKIALIERGQCTFASKVTNASNAGARAVLAFDNVAGEAPISMAGLSGTLTPAVMMSNADGLTVKAFLASNPGGTISIDPSTSVVAVPATPDVLATFSSRGPSSDFSIKPDLVAIGTNVYSATQNLFPGQGQYDASHFTYGDGTSFSTPMVSGAAAAVLQLLPNLTPAGIKSALANTANQIVTTDGSTQGTVIQVGNGLLDMGRAAGTAAIFSPTNLNFGVQSYTDSISLTGTIAITNVSAGSDQYALSVQPVIPGPAISLSTTNTDSIPSGGSATVSVTLQANAPLTGGYQGYIVVQSSRTSTTYTIPYWAGIYVPDSSRILTVSQGSSAANVFPSLADALAAANPGNIIEIADSQTYSVTGNGITISTNGQGLPLHGITIRAAAGQTPVIDGTTSSAASDLAVVGVRNVLIQGITINGGDVGIDILQPSASVPLSVTIDHCNIANQAASTSSVGVLVENGGDVDVTYSTISGSASFGVSAQGGAHLTMSGSTVQGNQSDGINAFESNVDLFNSTITGNLGVGANLDTCSGTLDNNTFSNNPDSFSGDGLELWDGTMTVTNNTFSANGSAGIYLASDTPAGPGPTGRIEKNTFQSNAEYGLQSDQSTNMQVIGNRLADNGSGFVARGTTTATLLNNIIVRSTAPLNAQTSSPDPAWGNGVYIDQSSSVGFVNNTVYRNNAHGIAVIGSAAINVQNSIVSQDAGGDLSGLTTNEIFNSLVGDGTRIGSTNLGGDPMFTNPNSDDFSLSPGSPAIDRGSNSAASLPFLDYNQQLRVASSGSPAGAGIVDLGAIEAGSSYPLNYPLLVSGFNSTLNDSFITGFAALDPASSGTTQATFSAYNPSGALISGVTNPNSLAIAAESQIPILDWQLAGFSQGSTQLGAVLATSLQKLVGFFLIFDPSFSRLADGVDVSSDTWSDLYLVRHENDSAGSATYQLFNPGVNPANVTATLFDPTGAQLDVPKTSTLAPKGQYMFTFNASPSSGGYVHVQSDRPVTGLELWGNTTEIAALHAAPASSETRLFFPHFAVNGGFTSMLGVVNTANTAANLTLTAFGNDGSVLGTPAQRSVNAHGQLFESASSLFGLSSAGTITGYAVVASDQPGITGFAAFDYDNGSVQSRAAVPSESIPRQKLLFSHVAHEVPDGAGDNYLTGIALLNPFGTTISYTLKVFDGSGAEIAEMTDVLAPHAKVAKVLSSPFAGAGFFTQPISLAGGHIEVTTDYQVLGFELFFTQSLTQLVAVMAQFPN